MVHDILCKQGTAVAYVILVPVQAAAGEGQWSEVQLEAEEVLQRDVPDICLLEHGGLQRSIVQTTTCKTE